MKAITNNLRIEFNYDAIDGQYDFFIITTADKYISGGAYILDKPISKLKADSVSFDGGRCLFVMFKHGVVSIYNLVDQIEDEKLSVKKIRSGEIKDYILFRLFMFSLNNFENEELKFNNITGKLFICSNKWLRKDRTSFMALSVNVDAAMNIICEAATFSLLSKFSNNKKVKDYPQYKLSDSNNALKRVLRSESGEGIYIKRALYGRKAELAFLNISQKDLLNNKAYIIYHVLDLLNNRYNNFFKISFTTVEVLQSIGVSKRDAFIQKAISEFKKKSLNFVNLTKGSEFEEDFVEIVKRLSLRLGVSGEVSAAVKNDANNIVLIHNKDFYEQNGYDDPHAKLINAGVVQCITVEDSLDKIIDDKDAIINTIIKEVVIKNDILFTHAFSLDDWRRYGLSGDFIFGKEKDGKHYFMIVHSDGTFEFSTKLNDFRSFANSTINTVSRLLIENKGKEKVIVVDDIGNTNIISRTTMFTLPNKDIFSMKQVSRSKESREANLAGLVDINLFEINGQTYYNVGIKGNGMNTNIPHAPLLYKVDRISNSKNMLPQLLETMSVEFVKYKSFTVIPYPIKYLTEWIIMQ